METPESQGHIFEDIHTQFSYLHTKYFSYHNSLLQLILKGLTEEDIVYLEKYVQIKSIYYIYQDNHILVLFTVNTRKISSSIKT